MQKSVDIVATTGAVLPGAIRQRRPRASVMPGGQGAGRARHDGEEERAPQPAEKHKGGIAEQESAVSISNVMLLCKSCSRPVRVGHEHRATARCGMQELRQYAGEIAASI